MRIDLRKPIHMLLALWMAVALTACAGLQPTNTTESLLAMETAATTARQIGMQGAVVGKLKKSQAQFVQDQADLIVAGVKTIRDLRASGDTAGAANQYEMTATILKALQTFLVQQGLATGVKP